MKKTKKTLKILLALLVVSSVMISVFPTIFAAESEFLSSHVVFKETTVELEDENGNPTGETQDYIRAEAFIRNYTSADEKAVLYCAVYDADKKLVKVETASGVNTVVRTDWVEMEDGYTAKAFIWEESNQKIVSNVATFGAESLTDAKLEITFDGQSFEDYIGEEFSWDTIEYTKKLTVSNGTVSYPAVTAKLAGYADNTASVKVVNDFESSKTTEITVEIGQRSEAERTSNVANTPGKVYSKPVTKTFKITYTEPDLEGYIKENEFAATGASFVTLEPYNYKATKSYTVGEGELKKIELEFSNGRTLRQIFVIKPTVSADRDVVVNADGTALEWDDYLLYSAPAYYIGNGEVGDSSKTTPVEFTAGTKTSPLPVFPETMDTNNDDITGTLIATDRNASTVGKHIFDMPEAYTGYNYIVVPAGNTSGKLSFWVNQSVEVTAFCTQAIKLKDENGEVTATKLTNASDYPNSRMIGVCFDSGSYDFWAYLVAQGVIGNEDIADYSDIEKGNYYLTWNAVENKVNPFIQSKFQKINTKIKYTGDVSLQGLSYEEILAKIVMESEAGLIKNLKLGAEFAAYNTKNVSASKGVFSNNSSLYTYQGEFKGWTDPSKPQRGAVISYPEVMELEGAEFIALDYGIRNGYDSYGYRNTDGQYIFYTFEAGNDAELILATATTNAWITADGWTKLAAVPLENLVFSAASAVESRWIWYIKNVKKGDTVTIRTVKSNAYPIVFAKPVN